MNIQCRFLEVAQHGLGCSIGLNFYALGENCALCHDCPVPAFAASTQCKYLEFYTILDKRDDNHVVKVELGCAFTHSGLDDLVECQSCPAFDPMPPEG